MPRSLESVLRVGLIRVYSGSYRRHRPSIEVVKEVANINRKLNLDLIIGPEWSLMNRCENEGPYSHEELKDLIRYFNNATAGTKTLFIPGTVVVATKSRNIYNMLLAFNNGRVVYSTIKNTNGGTDAFDKEDIYNLILDKGNHRFKFNGYRIGVEICSDSDSLFYSETDPVDIQLLISCGVRTTRLTVGSA